MFSTESLLISPIVPSSGSTCFNNQIFQNIRISFCLWVWVHCTLHWNIQKISWLKKAWLICFYLLSKYSFKGNVFLFCKLAEIRERCCSRILWHFQDFSWVSYLCSSWHPPPPPKRLRCKKSSQTLAECKNSRFPAFCQAAKLSRASSNHFLRIFFATSPFHVSSKLAN